MVKSSVDTAHFVVVFFDLLHVNAVEDLAAFLSALDETDALELGEVTTDGCEFNIDGVDEIGDAMLLFEQLSDDENACGMTQRFEHYGESSFVFLVEFHCASSLDSMYLTINAVKL